MGGESESRRVRSRLWYLLPILLHIVGGLIAYFVLKGSDPATAKNSLWLGIILSAAATTAGVAIYLAYLNDITAARERILTGSAVVNTAHGPIEYADVGRGDPPILVIHGAGGGYDQGLIVAGLYLGDEVMNNRRMIAPSRFGYLQTPIPSASDDASSAAQADAHAALLDALGIEQKVTVFGVSAGALSATEFAIKYPDRVSTLVLLVPAMWKPESAEEGSAEIGSNDFIMNTVLKSDFIMWMFTKVAGDQMLTFVGAPKELQQKMTPQEREEANQLVQAILPVSQRYEGIKQDTINQQNLERLALEEIRAPTIIIDARDVETYPGSRYGAEHIPNAEFIEFETGGHLLVGHGDEARDAIREFLE